MRIKQNWETASNSLTITSHVRRTCPSDVKGVDGKDVRACRLEVVPEVIVGDGQYHLVGVALLPVQLDEHPGVRAGPVHTARLDCYVVADILEGCKFAHYCNLYERGKRYVAPFVCLLNPFYVRNFLLHSLKRRRPSPSGTSSRTICPSSSLRSNHLAKKSTQTQTY